MLYFPRNLWIYLLAGLFWSLGLMAFFLTYNLHLLDLGFQETFIGQVSASMTIGSLLATFPASFLLSRFGLNRMIQWAALGTAISLLARCSVKTPLELLLFGLLNGAMIGTWVVAAPPFLARNTQAGNRNRAFSLNYGASIGMGAIAGLMVGKLPQLLRFSEISSVVPERHIVLVAGVVLVAMAFLLLLFLTSDPAGHAGRPPAATPSTPGSWRIHFQEALFRRFLIRLVVVIGLWSFFVGSFQPFFNVFFAKRYGQSLSSIGLIFSLSQGCQVMAVLAMPWIIEKFGRVRGIVSMQLAAAFCLPLIALPSQVRGAGFLYLTYLSFQVMSEPALEAFIMDSVADAQRNLASSIRYATLFTIQALAVWLAGIVIEHHGYAPLLVGLTCIGIAAALSFYFFFRSTSDSAPSTGLENVRGETV